MKVAVSVIAGLILVGGVWFFNTESFQRKMKSAKSEYLGGLERQCELASGNGTIQRRYKGKLDIQDSGTANKVLFDLNGKRTTIVVGGGTFVCDEI